MKRRDFLAAGAGSVALLAGCAGDGRDGDGGGPTTPTPDGETTTPGATTGQPAERTLVVGTYGAFVDAPSSSPGAWLKAAFESEFDATLRWETPDNEVNYYVERALRGARIDADVYVGLDTNLLIRLDDRLDSPLFVAPPEDALSRRGDVKSSLEFDPEGRAIPYDTGYVSLVYDETQVTAPGTFDGLLDEAFAGDLIVQNPTSSTTGQAFLLHTVRAKGDDGYLDYWQGLKENGVRVLGSWSDAYNAYTQGEAPMVVSYSTDQVYAHRAGEDLSKHRIRFLNDEGYANPEGMAMFAGTDRESLALSFLDFVLRPDVQREIAVRNVQYPATTTATLPPEFAQYAQEPPNAVTFTYRELQGNLEAWTDAWARQFASK